MEGVPGSRSPLAYLLASDLNPAMVVTVIPVRVVQMPLHQVIHVIPVRYGFMAAAGAVLVALLVRPALMVRRAVRRIRPTHGDRVLVHVVAMGVVQVPIVQVIRMAVVLDGRMAAARAVLVRVIPVLLTRTHPRLSLFLAWPPSRAWASTLVIRSTTCWSARK